VNHPKKNQNYFDEKIKNRVKSEILAVIQCRLMTSRLLSKNLKTEICRTIIVLKFNIHGSVHRNNILLYKFLQDAHVTEFILSDNCSTCFGRYHHPSSGVQTTVTTAPGNRYTILLSAAIVEDLELI
jgi:hypothetical protein